MDDEVHVVSIGTISFGTKGMLESCYLAIVNSLIARRIHVHIYPHWSYRNSSDINANFSKDFSDYLELERKYAHFHIYNSLTIEELYKKLPQYDFGIISGGCPQFGQTLNFLNQNYVESCYSGRIADFLDARLPILINDEVKYDYWLLKRYGIGIELKQLLRSDIKSKLLSYKDNVKMSKNLEMAINKLSIESNAHRLVEFYQKIIFDFNYKNVYKDISMKFKKIFKAFFYN